MSVFFESPGVTLYHGDCLDVLRELPDASVDAVVTDPPYGLEFMGREWDSFKPSSARIRTRVDGRTNGRVKSTVSTPEQYAAGAPFQQWCELWAAECLRVLKPGGHLLACGGTRTFHRLACAVEDAGFEIRDSIAWLYGSGFPKSLDVSKAIDKARGDNPDWRAVGAWLREQRTAAGVSAKALCATIGAHGDVNHGGAVSNWENGFSCPTWDQWLAMKAALQFGPEMDAEAWRLNGRKGAPGEAWGQREVTGAHRLGLGVGVSGPRALGDGKERRDAPATDAAREWQGWGTALKPAFEPIVVARKPLQGTVAANVQAFGTGALNIDATRIGADEPLAAHHGTNGAAGVTYGQRQEYVPGSANRENVHTKGRWPSNVVLDESQAAALDEQSGELAAGNQPRVRNADSARTAYGDFSGQTDLTHQRMDAGGASRFFYTAKADAGERVRVDDVAHPTVKPLSLMRWLVRLVTPPGGTVLEPFAGSGTTVEACILEGFQCIAIEREADYLPLIVQRVNRQRDPIAYTRAAGEDLGLFELGEAVS